MALTEETVVDRIEVLEDGQIQVRTATRVLRDGEKISETYHRHVVEPGADLNVEDARVKEIGTVAHTAQVISDYEAAKAAALAAMP